MEPPGAGEESGKGLRSTAGGTRDVGRSGKVQVRQGKGARGSGPRERMVPLTGNAGATLRWFVGDVRAQFGGGHARPGVPLLPSERRNAGGPAARVGDEALRPAPKGAAGTHLPDRPGAGTPRGLRACSPSRRDPAA